MNGPYSVSGDGRQRAPCCCGRVVSAVERGLVGGSGVVWINDTTGRTMGPDVTVS